MGNFKTLAIITNTISFRVHSSVLNLNASSLYSFQAYDFLQEDSLSEKSRHQRMKEQKEQYKQVSLLISLPALFSYLSCTWPVICVAHLLNSCRTNPLPWLQPQKCHDVSCSHLGFSAFDSIFAIYLLSKNQCRCWSALPYRCSLIKSVFPLLVHWTFIIDNGFSGGIEGLLQSGYWCLLLVVLSVVHFSRRCIAYSRSSDMAGEMITFIVVLFPRTQVRAHVKKDDGRVQAYGWSLPTKVQSETCNFWHWGEQPAHECRDWLTSFSVFSDPVGAGDAAATKPGAHPQLIPHSKTHVPVPVPVYCR